MPARKQESIERVQTGIRVEKRILKVLKALAEYKDLTLGDLVEGIALHAFEGKPAFSADTLRQIKRLREVYGLELTAADSHRLEEREARN
jgi:predicted DNA-binding ribbon-helix-helix protein